MSSLGINNSWDAYLKYGIRQFFKQKATIYCEKDDGVEGFYYLKKGIIKISKTNYASEERIIDIVCSEQLFGEQTADGGMYFSTASALEDCIVYFFSYEKIRALMKEDHQFRMLVYTSMTEKLKVLSDNVVFQSLPSEQLIARTILILRDKYVNRRIPFNQQELCRYTNLNRITVYKVFKKWDDEIVSLKDKNITVKNVNVLQEIAAI
ncbi:MAG: Crp/Fnr family transcriptional regulator [Oceanobacillus sp.]|nr:Crp/Fnr family transcriptional regulator [Oceanobacillus sp.]